MEYFANNEVYTDDLMNDLFENWLENQDIADIIELAEKWCICERKNVIYEFVEFLKEKTECNHKWLKTAWGMLRNDFLNSKVIEIPQFSGTRKQLDSLSIKQKEQTQ